MIGELMPPQISRSANTTPSKLPIESKHHVTALVTVWGPIHDNKAYFNPTIGDTIIILNVSASVYSTGLEISTSRNTVFAVIKRKQIKCKLYMVLLYINISY